MQNRPSMTENPLPTVSEFSTIQREPNGVSSTDNACHDADGDHEIQEYPESTALGTNARHAIENDRREREPLLNNSRSKIEEMAQTWRHRKWLMILWALLSFTLIVLIIVPNHLSREYKAFLSIGPSVGFIASTLYFVSLTKTKSPCWVKHTATIVFILSAFAFVLDIPNAILLFWSLDNSEDSVDATVHNNLLLCAVFLMGFHGIFSLVPFRKCTKVQSYDIPKETDARCAVYEFHVADSDNLV